MQVTEYKAEYRLSQWSEIIREQKQSGKNVREWCLEHGMTTNAYYSGANSHTPGSAGT